MIISLELELKDLPSQLLKLIQGISQLGGSIRSISHDRERFSPRGMLPTRMELELAESKLPELSKLIAESGANMISLGKTKFSRELWVMLIGHIVHSDLTHTINSIDSSGWGELTQLQLSMPGIEQKSCALLRISSPGDRELRMALEELSRLAKAKDLILISPI